MSMLFSLSKELGNVIGLISLLISIWAWLVPTSHVKISMRKKIRYVGVFVVLFLIINHFIMLQYTKIPNVKGFKYEYAYEKLIDSELIPSADIENTQTENSIIRDQYPIGDSVVKKGTKIFLQLGKDENKKPYTVRETYMSARSGEEGKTYKLVSTESKLVGTYFITYYTYDVTYY